MQALHVGRIHGRIGQKRKPAAERDAERELCALCAADVEVEERAVEPQRANLLAPLARVRIERADESAGRMPCEQHGLIDFREGGGQVGEILGQVLAEARMLVRAQ